MRLLKAASARMPHLVLPVLPIMLIMLVFGSQSAYGYTGGTITLKDDATGGSCYLIGTWNVSTKTCTMTTNFFGDSVGIEIQADGLTLDGNGHVIVANYPPTYAYGVVLNGRTGVTVKNITFDYAYAIMLDSSQGNTIVNNWHSASSTAGATATVTVKNSSYNTIKGNTTRISLINGSQYNQVLNNTNSSLTLNGAGYNTLDGNSTTYFDVKGAADSDFENDIDTSNTSRGRPIWYIKHASGQVFDATTNAGTFYCIWCDSVTIRDLTLPGPTASRANDTGLYLRATTNSRIENVNASYNASNGIWLDSSSDNVVAGNTAAGNYTCDSRTDQCYGSGIFLSGSFRNTITGNSANANGYNNIALVSSGENQVTGNIFGTTVSIFPLTARLASSNNNVFTRNRFTTSSEGNELQLTQSNDNTFYRNDFILGSASAISISGTGNVFNLGAPTGGNHWSIWTSPDADSDGFVDNPFVINSSAQDNLPWVGAAWAASKPQLSLLLGSPVSYWNSYSDYLARTVSVNWKIRNDGIDPAFNIVITGSANTAGVTTSTYLPFNAGSLGAGATSSNIRIAYHVPDGVSTWRTSLHATAVDMANNTYVYP